MIKNALTGALNFSSQGFMTDATKLPTWVTYTIIAALIIIVVMSAYITIKNNKDR